MHTPRHYRADGPEREARLVRENPFGLIICAAEAGSGIFAAPEATHVPMLRRPGPDGPPVDGQPLLGGTIVGHLARTNPQSEALRAAGSALAVFLGPDGYVSPTWYEPSHPQAPTWNYAAVHLSGPVRVIDDRDEALTIMRATIDTTEAYAGTGWDPTSSLDYIDKLLAGVTAFEITVEEVRSAFKLSQNKTAETQHRVHTEFAASPHGRDRELADLMADVLSLDGDAPGAAEPDPAR